MTKRCHRCNGKKKIDDIGGINKICDLCGGEGVLFSPPETTKKRKRNGKENRDQ